MLRAARSKGVRGPERPVHPEKKMGENEEYDISYWTMDQFGNHLTRVNEFKTLNWRIKKLLPSPYNEYKSVWGAKRLTRKSNWVLFAIDKGTGTVLDDEVFVMRLDVPGSIKKIAKGFHASW